MKRYPILFGWLIVTFSFLFIGCPGKGGQSGTGADSTSGSTSTGGGEAPGTAQPGVPAKTGKAIVPFSGDKEKIKKKMAMITGATQRLDTLSGSEAALSYKGGQFGGFVVDDWTFLFHQGQMMLGQVNYNDQTTQISADSMYSALSRLMVSQYGTPIIDSKNRISQPLSAYSDAAQQFIAKVGKSLYQDFRLWTSGTDAEYIITVNKVQWNTAGGSTFVHIAFYNRALSEDYFAGEEKKPKKESGKEGSGQ